MKILARIAVATVLALSLIGCGAPVDSDKKAPEAKTEIDGVTRIDDYRTITEVEVELKDGRKVICLALEDYRAGGLHCLEPEAR